ncbi:MAG: hypothetical protein ABFC57_17950 [Veillonellales bacterium]
MQKQTESINAVLPPSRNKPHSVRVHEIRSLTAISPEMQKSVWDEFKELGYEDKMKPSETLNIIRFLFNGSKIGDKARW